uniref:Uncharacterized protein n=1 Tax=Sphaerodactylus townsendi TaxID=933632 RepID=A0ACB8FLU6_9SAUR
MTHSATHLHKTYCQVSTGDAAISNLVTLQNYRDSGAQGERQGSPLLPFIITITLQERIPPRGRHGNGVAAMMKASVRRPPPAVRGFVMAW